MVGLDWVFSCVGEDRQKGGSSDVTPGRGPRVVRRGGTAGGTARCAARATGRSALRGRSRRGPRVVVGRRGLAATLLPAVRRATLTAGCASPWRWRTSATGRPRRPGSRRRCASRPRAFRTAASAGCPARRRASPSAGTPRRSPRPAARPSRTGTAPRRPSTRWSARSKVRGVEAIRKLATAAPDGVKRSSGSSTRLPTTVIWVSPAMSGLLGMCECVVAHRGRWHRQAPAPIHRVLSEQRDASPWCAAPTR